MSLQQDHVCGGLTRVSELGHCFLEVAHMLGTPQDSPEPSLFQDPSATLWQLLMSPEFSPPSTGAMLALLVACDCPYSVTHNWRQLWVSTC